MKKMLSMLTVLASACLALPAAAQFAKPEDAIKYRQSALFVMGQHFGRIGGMANGRTPYDAKAASAKCRDRGPRGEAALGGIRRGHRKGAQRPSRRSGRSRPSSRSQDKLVAETEKLVAVAKTNNLDELKAVRRHRRDLQGMPRQPPEPSEPA